MNKIREIATLLMYSGPSIEEICTEALAKGYTLNIERNNDIITLVISSTTYGVTIIDKYFYDNERKLIKQILFINNKEKMVFDKYKEAMQLIKELEIQSSAVA